MRVSSINYFEQKRLELLVHLVFAECCVILPVLESIDQSGAFSVFMFAACTVFLTPGQPSSLNTSQTYARLSQLFLSKFTPY